MQELIDKLNNVKPTQYCSIETIRGWAESLLEKEKEQIIKTYIFANIEPYMKPVEEYAEQYYNETYTNPDRDENGRI